MFIRKSPTMFNDKEVKVAGILLELPTLVFAERTKLHGCARSRFIALSGVAKRKRSDAVEPSLSSPVETPEGSSPSAPLSFCPSEPEEKPFKLPKQITETPEASSERFQEHLEYTEPQELHGQKLLRHCEDVLQSRLANLERNPPEIKHEEQVPGLDLEMRFGLSAINRDEPETQNNVQQQNHQQITTEVEVIKEETKMMMMRNNVAKGLRDTVKHVNAISQADQFCSSMDNVISLDGLKAKQAREWRVKTLGENGSNRLKFFKS